jgi:opacity protein-like surface antigen
VKNFAIAAGAMLALLTVAHAADLPHPQPVYEQAAVGKMPIGKAPIGKGPIGKAPIVPEPVLRRGY